VVLAETFVHPALYRGTAYQVSGWSRLGATRGWKRSAEDFYQKHDRPKEVWVRELVKRACQRLRVIERVLLRWQDQVLGPTQDRLVILDGKEHRHADGETVSAVDGTGRRLGTVPVPTDSNEIPAVRQQLAKLDVVGKIVLADPAHTQVQTVQQVLYEGGGDYLLTVNSSAASRSTRSTRWVSCNSNAATG
jgi:hypothetical protein